MFEPVHGSAPKYKGLGTANPMASVLTVGLMLEDLGHKSAARAVEGAVCQALAAGVLTADLGGTCATVEVGDYLAEAVTTIAVEAV